MKNLHLLPTNKPSRLYINSNKNLVVTKLDYGYPPCRNVNIYITSDEEAKNNAWDNYEHTEGSLYSTSFKNGFELGAIWQQERSYSEEEVKNIISNLVRDCYYMQEPNQDVAEWFEQFKKIKKK